MTGETYDILNNIFNGQTPIRRTNPKAGESEYYYFVPGQDNWTSLSEAKTVDVPSADTPNPYLQPQTNSLGQQSMTPVPQMATQPSTSQIQQQSETSAWDTLNQWKDNIADAMQAGAVGYTTGATLGNFDETMGGATAALTGNPDNYSMGRDAIRQLQNNLSQKHPYIYGGAEFVGAMTSPMHLFKDTTKVNKALNATTDTLNASAGYAENWNDFSNSLVVNGVANSLGLAADYSPVGRGLGVVGRKAFTQGINQGMNYFADKAKNIFYNNDE